MNQQEWMDKLKDEGFTDLNIVEMEADTSKPEHIHEQHTVHILISGELTSEDEKGEKLFKEGDRFDIPAGTKHSVSFGPQGCKMLVGVKN